MDGGAWWAAFMGSWRVGHDWVTSLSFSLSLSCIGETNDNPFQCSCLENPRDGGAWWAAVYGVAQSRTRLQRLSSSSSSNWSVGKFLNGVGKGYHEGNTLEKLGRMPGLCYNRRERGVEGCHGEELTVVSAAVSNLEGTCQSTQSGYIFQCVCMFTFK